NIHRNVRLQGRISRCSLLLSYFFFPVSSLNRSSAFRTELCPRRKGFSAIGTKCRICSKFFTTGKTEFRTCRNRCSTFRTYHLVCISSLSIPLLPGIPLIGI